MPDWPKFELRTPCASWGCRVVALHLLRGTSTHRDGTRLIGRACQACGHQWQEAMEPEVSRG